MKVRDLMTMNPQTIGPKENLAVAAEKMQQGRFRRLPVVDSAGNLIAIVTDGDLREHAGYLSKTLITSAMVENVTTVAPDASIETAAQMMLDGKIGGLPVVDNGKLIGIITESDLVRGFLQLLRGSTPQ